MVGSTVCTTCSPTRSVSAGTHKYIYVGYGSSCATLTATASGFSGAVTYRWSTNATTASISVCPTTTTTYRVTATDANNCTATASVKVSVTDVRCSSSGNKKDKVQVCHNGNTLCIASSAVSAHLSHGDKLGKCSSEDDDDDNDDDHDGDDDRVASNTQTQFTAVQSLSAVEMFVFPNPAQSKVTVQLRVDTEGDGQISVVDITGRTVLTTQQRIYKGVNEYLVDIQSLPHGIYLIQYKDALQNVKGLRIVKN